MNLKKLLFISIIFLLISCNQKQEKTKKLIESKSESLNLNTKKEISEFSLNFSPKGPSAMDSIPESIIQRFKKLRTIDKEAHEKYVTLVFAKLYVEHLQCCHQSYIIETFPSNKSEYDFDKLSIVNEFAFMSNYLDVDKLPEIWTTGIIEKWLDENPKLLEFEPIGKYNQMIKNVSKEIKNGDYWNK